MQRKLIKTNPYNQRVSGIVMLLGGYLCFSIGDVGVKILTTRYPVFEIISILGFLFAIFITVKVGVIRKMFLLKASQPGILLLRGILNMVSFSVCYSSYSHMPLSDAYSILFLSPIILTILSSWLLKEKVTWQIWLAVCAGFCGVLIILRPGAISSQSIYWFAFLMPFTSSANNLIMRYASRENSNESILIYSALILAFGSLMFSGGNLLVPSIKDTLLFLGIGTIITGAWFLVIQGYRLTTTPVGAPFQYTQLIWATLFGWVVWHTLPDLWSFVGMAIVAASGIITLWYSAGLIKNRCGT